MFRYSKILTYLLTTAVIFLVVILIVSINKGPQNFVVVSKTVIPEHTDHTVISTGKTLLPSSRTTPAKIIFTVKGGKRDSDRYDIERNLSENFVKVGDTITAYIYELR